MQRLLKALANAAAIWRRLATGLKTHHHHQVAAKAADAEVAHERMFLLGRIHSQKTQRLMLARLVPIEDIELRHRAVARAQGMKRGLEGDDIAVSAEMLKSLVHLKNP
jgi:hypothetical protein